jgi:hypothetical protein
MPELQTAWHAFHDARVRKAAEEWLNVEGIEATLT